MGRFTENPMSKSIRIKKPKIDYPKLLLDQILTTDLPVPVREHKFHPTRRWRFDLAFLESKLAVEVEGGIWTYGRHNRAISFIKDMEKYNEACLLGWNLLRFTTDMVKKGESIKIISKFFKEQ